MADGYNSNKTNNSAQFPDDLREQVKKGIGRGTRGRGLRYLAAIKHSQQVEMPPKHAPKFKLGNFAGNALAELNAANARPVTQRNAKRAAILQKAKNRGKNPAYAGIPYELNSNKSKTRRNGANQTPPSGSLKKELVSAENLPIKQNEMANDNLNALLGGLPVKGAAKPANKAAAKPVNKPANASLPPGTTVQSSGFGPKYSTNFEPSSNATLSAFGTGGKASNINTGGIELNTNLQGPAAFASSNSNFSNAGGNTQAAAAARAAEMKMTGTRTGANWGRTNAQLNAARIGNTMMAAANTNYSGGFKASNAAAVSNFEPSSNALLPGYGTGGKASNINTGGIALNTNLQGPLRLAPQESNFANAGTNTQAAAAARVQAMKNATAGTNTPFAPSGPSLGDLNDADLIVDVVFSDVNAIPRGGKIGVNLTKKDGSKFLGLPSMSVSLPGMPSMPKFSMPRFSGPKIDLSWLVLPSFGHFKLPETDIKGMLGKFLAALPSISREQILAALKKGGKFIGLALLSPLLLAAWLYDHGFNLNIKLDGLTGGLISLEDWFLGGNQPAVKEIGRKLKMATDIAKRVVTNTIAEQEFLQKQINDKTRTAESVKQQILASLDSQIANIKSTLANLSADIKQVTVDPEYDNLIDEIDFEGYKGNNSKSANANLMAELNLLLDSIQKAYEGMAEGDEATVAKANVEKFKQIRKNFDDMLSLPQKMRDQLKDAPASAVGAKLKELGRDARSRTAKLGYNVGQFFSRGASRVASMFGRGQKFTSANQTRKNAVAPRNNVQMMNNPIGAGNQTKKPSLWNRVKGFGSKAAGFFSRKKSPNVSAASRGLNAYKSSAIKYPGAAAAARTRKLRRYRR